VGGRKPSGEGLRSKQHGNFNHRQSSARIKYTGKVFILNMGLIQLLILLGLSAGTAGFIYNADRRKRLEAAFYQLLRQQDSCISLIQLIAISQVSSQTAKVFLDEQVRLLNGIPEVDDDGDTFYRFPKLRLPAAIVNDDW
jgi:hypothetical protein